MYTITKQLTQFPRDLKTVWPWNPWIFFTWSQVGILFLSLPRKCRLSVPKILMMDLFIIHFKWNSFSLILKVLWWNKNGSTRHMGLIFLRPTSSRSEGVIWNPMPLDCFSFCSHKVFLGSFQDKFLNGESTRSQFRNIYFALSLLAEKERLTNRICFFFVLRKCKTSPSSPAEMDREAMKFWRRRNRLARHKTERKKWNKKRNGNASFEASALSSEEEMAWISWREKTSRQKFIWGQCRQKFRTKIKWKCWKVVVPCLYGTGAGREMPTNRPWSC